MDDFVVAKSLINQVAFTLRGFASGDMEIWLFCGRFCSAVDWIWREILHRNLVRNLVRKRQKQRINIGKFGDISLAFIRERKNELKLKSSEFVWKKSRICMKTATNLPKWQMSG